MISCKAILFDLLTLLIANVFVLGSDSPLVLTQDGAILGRVDYTTGQSKKYFAFQGIPYAEPPVNDLRFRSPQKASPWFGILVATSDRDECVQETIPSKGSEDCLYVNIYTPSLDEFSQLPVIVFIHGGAFSLGNSSYAAQGPDYLLEEDVIYVSLQYRLGVFGFLSTEDMACPGNMGLKDQVMALKWVQTNIDKFGGDPKKVTIFGQSAGAAAVSYLLQTPLTAGLFRAAIMDSGTALCTWSLKRDARETAFKIGQALEINTNDSQLLIEGLRKSNTTLLQLVASAISTTNMLGNPLRGIQYGPVTEPFHEDALFWQKSHEQFSNGNFHRVPTIIGFNSNEYAAAGRIPDPFLLYLVEYDTSSTTLVPEDITTNDTIRDIAGKEIRERYFEDVPLVYQMDSFVRFVSHYEFVKSIRQSVILQSKYAPVYFYEFSYEGGLGGKSNRVWKGVGHSEELGYIFRTYYANVSDSDALMRYRMVKLWTNFAKTGNPTPMPDILMDNVSWKSATPFELSYLNIDLNMRLDKDPFRDYMSFWDELYAKYGSPPYDTY